MMSNVRRYRRGVVLISVFACVMAVILVHTSLMRSAVVARRYVRREARLTQCEWLVASGLHLATSKLKVDPQYAGEVWQIKDARLAGPAAVSIVVQSIPGQSDRRRISVQAQYPLKQLHRALRKKTWTIHIKP